MKRIGKRLDLTAHPAEIRTVRICLENMCGPAGKAVQVMQGLFGMAACADQMFFQAVPGDIVPLLTALPAVFFRDGQLVVDRESGILLAGAPGTDPGFSRIDFETKPGQKGSGLVIYFPGVKISGESQVIAVPGISDAAWGAPFFHIVIKGLHDQVGNIGRRWSALGKNVVTAAEGSKQRPDRRREERAGKGMLVYADVCDISEEIFDIHLKNPGFPNVRRSVLCKRDSLPVCAGAVRDGQVLQNMVQDIFLYGFQWEIGFRDFPESSVLFGDSVNGIMILRMIRKPVEQRKTLLIGAAQTACQSEGEKKFAAVLFCTVFPEILTHDTLLFT